MNPEITFNAELHEYRNAKGEIVPSVTQVLTGIGLLDFGAVKSDVLDTAAQRGTIVHRITELHDKGEEFDDDDNDLIPFLGYFNAYKKFLSDFGIKIFQSIEEIIYSKQMGYAGTLDRIAIIGTDKMLFDIKTGAEHPAHELQIGGYYGALMNPQQIKTAGTLYLFAEGTYKFSPCNPENSLLTFLAALNLYKWLKEHNLLKKGK